MPTDEDDPNGLRHALRLRCSALTRRVAAAFERNYAHMQALVMEAERLEAGAEEIEARLDRKR